MTPISKSATSIAVLAILAVLASGITGRLALAQADRAVELRTRTTGRDWPRFLGPDATGKSSETGLALAWPDSGPPLRWHVEIGEGFSMPSVALGRLFVFDRQGDRARLLCRHAETGEELWRAEYPTDYQDMYGFSNGPRSSPVVDEDRVYTFGVEGRLRCHSVADGKLLWEIDTTRRFNVVQNFFGVGSTPFVEGDLLIVPVGGSPPDTPGIQSGKVRGGGSGIVAVDKRTGEVRYQTSDELASYSSPVVVTIGEHRQGLAFMRGGLVGFDPVTGRIGFRFPWRAKKLESVNASNPVVIGDKVLISESYGPGAALLRVSRDAYEVLWQDPARNKSLETHWMTPIYHDGYVYASSGSGSGDAELRAVEFRTGKVVWRKPGLGRSTLLWVDRHLIVLTERGKLLVVRATPEAYEQVAQVTLALPLPAKTGDAEQSAGSPLINYPAWNAPILSHGLLYVRGKDRLACFDLLPPKRRQAQR
jgi:outer membrane protein assembly factor BamB